jgi:DNA-binding sugar fermentation-stimulating protein
LRKAKKEGVHVLAATCKVTMNTLELQHHVEIKLD